MLTRYNESIKDYEEALEKVYEKEKANKENQLNIKKEKKDNLVADLQDILGKRYIKSLSEDEIIKSASRQMGFIIKPDGSVDSPKEIFVLLNGEKISANYGVFREFYER